MQRSQIKRITRDALILRHMRISKKFSLNQAGKIVGISGSAIAHIEQGRMDISKARIETLVTGYGFTQAEFLEYYDGKEIPKNLRDECIALIKNCKDSKLSILFPILENLAN